uniref:Shieldin complex subunit 2 C-terminal domain-containing protein n=1 Tax=Oreochromis aureus TaxID=47969 RepID=A0AAZ1XQN1_OREAU
MCDRKKIHVFLGAPPPSCSPASEPGAGLQEADRAPVRWRHLELTWRDGQLKPAGEAFRDRTGGRSNHGVLLWSFYYVSCKCAGSHRPWLSRKRVSVRTLYHLKPERPPAAPSLSSQTHYLTTWTLSQALILRGSVQSASSLEKIPPKHTQTPPSVSSSTPELFSPATPSPAASAELFSHPCLTPRVEEGGVVLEATTDGVLCSQESTTDAESPTKSPAESPSSKKARVSPESPDRGTTTELHSPTTLLARCDKPGVRYSVLVAVVHPCHLKEVKVKSGPSAGTSVPLASIVVTDQSGVEMKVVLWRRAAFWALTVGPGDVLLITALQVNEDRWRGEMVLQSTFSSKLLNVGQITSSSTPPGKASLRPIMCLQSCTGSVTSLFLFKRRPLLVSLPRRPPQDLNRLPYATLTSLRANALVHALLRVTHTHIKWRAEADSRSRSAVQLNAVLTVEQPEDQQGAVLLWGAAVDWLPRFSRDKGALWNKGCTSKMDTAPVLDSSTSLEGIMVALSGDITYTGCGRCSAELDTDANDIYRPCYPCLPHTAVRRYYRPGVLTVSGRGSIQVCVQVPPDPLQKILNAPPDKLHRSSGETVVAAERIHTLLSLPRKTFIATIRSNFLCDENSIPISQDFMLLDLQFPPEPSNVQLNRWTCS